MVVCCYESNERNTCLNLYLTDKLFNWYRNTKKGNIKPIFWGGKTGVHFAGHLISKN